MPKRSTPKFDEIGPWTEVKLDILKRYAVEYSKILSRQENPRLSHVYIDAFAGAGMHISKTTREMVPGSPLNALLVQPAFKEYFLIDLDADRAVNLRQMIGPRKDVHVYAGDCNDILLAEVFPQVQFKDYRRGLCVLDPYKLNLEWHVIREAGAMKSLDIFINFPIMDINRNVLRHDVDKVSPEDLQRMNALWGDESWKDIVYSSEGNLFNLNEKVATNETLAAAFGDRLKRVAGFKKVPKPLPMKNKTNAIVYYLFFASQKGPAEEIVQWIFNKYKGGADVPGLHNRMD